VRRRPLWRAKTPHTIIKRNPNSVSPSSDIRAHGGTLAPDRPAKATGYFKNRSSRILSHLQTGLGAGANPAAEAARFGDEILGEFLSGSTTE